jgi:hypothetical protein
MKKTILSLFVICMITGLSNNLIAQTSATATNNASCTIIAPIGITAGQDLMFGDIIKGAGNVTVTPLDIRSTDNNDLNYGGGQGTIQAANFTVSGEVGYTYAITLPANDVVKLSLLDATDMSVNNFTSIPSETGTINPESNIVKVGATLTVAATQDSGDYTGTFDVTVAYN